MILLIDTFLLCERWRHQRKHTVMWFMTPYVLPATFWCERHIAQCYLDANGGNFQHHAWWHRFEETKFMDILDAIFLLLMKLWMKIRVHLGISNTLYFVWIRLLRSWFPIKSCSPWRVLSRLDNYIDNLKITCIMYILPNPV